MVCTCGKRLPVDNPSSICNGCLRRGLEEEGLECAWLYGDEDDESMDGDHESGLASAGFGTDEDYGKYDDTPMYDDYYGGE